MARPRALERLAEHRQGIDAILDTARRLLAAPVRDTAGLASARWSMVRALTAYQMFLEREVVGPALAAATPSQAHRLLLLKRSVADFADDFRAYVQRWSTGDVENEWPSFRVAATGMIARIGDQVARDEKHVMQMLPN